MKSAIIILFSLLLGQVSYSQLITTSPLYPTENDSIVVFLDATKPGATGLLNYTGTVYVHTGVTDSTGNWQHVIGTWGVNTSQPALTRLGANLYQLTIGYPRKFYSVSSVSEHITALDFVFRSADGTKQTSPDIFYTLFA